MVRIPAMCCCKVQLFLQKSGLFRACKILLISVVLYFFFFLVLWRMTDNQFARHNFGRTGTPFSQLVGVSLRVKQI